MANNSILHKVLSISPYIEIAVRYLYWKNIKRFSIKPSKKRKIGKVEILPVNLDAIFEMLSEFGVEKGSLVVIHAAYSPLNGTSFTPKEIVEKMLAFLGEKGTLCMPTIPIFSNSPKKEDYLTANISESFFEYDVRKVRISTGVLPKELAKHNEAVRSRHPINTMVAVGPLAGDLMKDNLKGPSPLACGINSSWNKCVEKDAWIVGLGTDLTHSLTMIHVAEDVLDDKWPIKNWYRAKRFIIKDDNFEETITLRERNPKWGALHFAERTLCKDLIQSRLLKSKIVDGVIVEAIKAKDLINFLNSKNVKGYPYFGSIH